MYLSGEAIADPPLYIEVWIEADECARQFSRVLNVLNIKVFIGIVNQVGCFEWLGQSYTRLWLQTIA